MKSTPEMISGLIGERWTRDLLAKLQGRRFAKIYTRASVPSASRPQHAATLVVKRHPYLHLLPDPQQPALRVRLDSSPFRPTRTAKKHGINLDALLQHSFCDGVFVLVERGTAAQVEVALELGTRDFFNDIEHFQRLSHDFGADVVAGEDKESAALGTRGIGAVGGHVGLWDEPWANKDASRWLKSRWTRLYKQSTRLSLRHEHMGDCGVVGRTEGPQTGTRR